MPQNHYNHLIFDESIDSKFLFDRFRGRLGIAK